MFCVSNQEYNKLRKPKEDDSILELDAESTGIPALRKFGMTLGASRIETARESYADRCRLLIDCVAMYLDRGFVVNREKVLSEATAPQKVYIIATNLIIYSSHRSKSRQSYTNTSTKDISTFQLTWQTSFVRHMSLNLPFNS